MELFVRRVKPEPSAFIVYISGFPSLSESNAIRPFRAPVSAGCCSGSGVGGATTLTVLAAVLYPCWSSVPYVGARAQSEYLSAHIQPRTRTGRSPAVLGVTRRVRTRLAFERHAASSLSTSRWSALIVLPLERLSESPVL